MNKNEKYLVKRKSKIYNILMLLSLILVFLTFSGMVASLSQDNVKFVLIFSIIFLFFVFFNIYIGQKYSKYTTLLKEYKENIIKNKVNNYLQIFLYYMYVSDIEKAKYIRVNFLIKDLNHFHMSYGILFGYYIKEEIVKSDKININNIVNITNNLSEYL